MTSMILSLGGTPEPLITSMSYHRPDNVLFFCSRETESRMDEVRTGLEKNNIPWPTRTDIISTPDAQDIVRCYRILAQEIPRWCTRHKVDENTLVVDFTGGTKAMTAALILYSSFRFKRLAYVGGTQRSKGGVGEVITGTEHIVFSANPLEATLMARWEMWRQYVAATRYALAAEEAKYYKERIDEPFTKRLLSDIESMFSALAAWDSFLPPKCYMGKLKDAIANMRVFLAANPRVDMRQWLIGIETLYQHMANLQQENPPGKTWVIDLLANARRRAQCEQKYEDAVARLYSAFERLAQQRVEAVFGHPTSKFPPDKVPPTLRSDYVRRFTDDDHPKFLKFGLNAAMGLLREAAEKPGQKFFAQDSPWIGEASLLQARNNSVLGHGLTPVTRELCDKFWQATVELWEIDETSLPVVAALPDLPVP